MTDTRPGTPSGSPLPGARPRPAGAPRATSTRPAGVDAIVDCAVYVDGRREPPVDPGEALAAAREHGGFVWLGLFEPTEEELGRIAGH